MVGVRQADQLPSGTPKADALADSDQKRTIDELHHSERIADIRGKNSDPKISCFHPRTLNRERIRPSDFQPDRLNGENRETTKCSQANEFKTMTLSHGRIRRISTVPATAP